MKLFKWSFHYTGLNNKDLLQLCPLYRLLSTPSLDQSNLSLLGFLLPWMWGISSRFLQQSAAAAPYLDEGYLLTAAPPDLERGIAPLGPPAPVQPPLLGYGAAPPSRRPWPRTRDSSSRPLLRRGRLALSPWPPGTLGRCPWPQAGVAPPRRRPWPQTWGSSSQPSLRRRSLALWDAAPDFGYGVTPLGRRPSGMGSSWLLPLTSDVGQLL